MSTIVQSPYSVTLPSAVTENAKNFKGEKPLWHSLKLLAVVPLADSGYWLASGRAPIVELAELCVWGPKSSNASRVYASIWIHANNERYFAGHGTAGGYGYCKASAASCEAMASAGLKFTRERGANWHFGGAGMSEVEKAVYAIGRALGFEDSSLYVVHGA